MALTKLIIASLFAISLESNANRNEERYQTALANGAQLTDSFQYEAAAAAYAEAYALLEGASNGQHPDLIDIAAYQANALILAGRGQSALEITQPVIEREDFELAAPTSRIWILAARAEALLMLARSIEAARSYQQAIIIGEVAALGPDWTATLWIDRARALSRSGLVTQAITELDALVINLTERGYADPAVLDEALVFLAVLLAQMNDSRAEPLIEQLLENQAALIPVDIASLYNAMAETYRRSDRSEQAQAAFEAALASLEMAEAGQEETGLAVALDFERSAIFSNMAILADAMGESEMAIEYAQRSIDLEPSPQALTLLAHLSADSLDIEAAMGLLDQADFLNTETVNDEESAARQLGWRADFHRREGNWEGALSASRRAAVLFQNGRREGRSWATSDLTRGFIMVHLESAWNMAHPE